MASTNTRAITTSFSRESEGDPNLDSEKKLFMDVVGNGEILWWVECNGDTKIFPEMIESIHPWAHYICKIPEDIASARGATENAELESTLKNNFNHWYKTANAHLNPIAGDGENYAGLLPTFTSETDRQNFVRYFHNPGKGTMKYELKWQDVSKDVETVGTPYFYDSYKASILPPLPVSEEDYSKANENDGPSDGEDIVKRNHSEWSPCLGSSGSASVCSHFNENGKKTEYYIVVKASPDHMIAKYRKIMLEKASEGDMTVEDLVSDPNTTMLDEIVRMNVRRMAAQFMEILGISIPYVLTVEDGMARNGDIYEPNHARGGLVDVWDLPKLKEEDGQENCRRVLFSKNYYLPRGRGHPSVVILPFGGQQFDVSTSSSDRKYDDGLRTCSMIVVLKPKDGEEGVEDRKNVFPYLRIRNDDEFVSCMKKWTQMGYNVYEHKAFLRTKTVVCTFVEENGSSLTKDVKTD